MLLSGELTGFLCVIVAVAALLGGVSDRMSDELSRFRDRFKKDKGK